MSVAAHVLRGVVLAYRYLLSPVLPATCRYAPSCSAYALEALQRHGALVGGWLTVRRVGRCHPWGGTGFDPVPDSRSRMHVGIELRAVRKMARQDRNTVSGSANAGK